MRSQAPVDAEAVRGAAAVWPLLRWSRSDGLVWRTSSSRARSTLVHSRQLSRRRVPWPGSPPRSAPVLTSASASKQILDRQQQTQATQRYSARLLSPPQIRPKPPTARCLPRRGAGSTQSHRSPLETARASPTMQRVVATELVTTWRGSGRRQ